MKKDNNLLYNDINTVSSNFFPNNKILKNNLHNSLNNNINNFKLEYVIGKGGFGKVSFNNKYLLFKKRNRFGKLNVKQIINIML